LKPPVDVMVLLLLFKAVTEAPVIAPRLSAGIPPTRIDTYCNNYRGMSVVADWSYLLLSDRQVVTRDNNCKNDGFSVDWRKATVGR
jgi:hypothetical protein